MREYEIKGGVWVFQLKILIFSYRFDDFTPCLVHVEMNASHIFGPARLCEFFGRSWSWTGF